MVRERNPPNGTSYDCGRRTSWYVKVENLFGNRGVWRGDARGLGRKADREEMEAMAGEEEGVNCNEGRVSRSREWLSG